jgi:hypothetical protein
MRTPRSILVGLTIVASTFLGCGRSEVATDTVAEGTIYSVAYRTEDGHVEGFTRLNESRAAPGGNGSWNVDAHGRLTRDYLFITRPQQHDLA